MKFTVRMLPPQVWSQLASNAHVVVFKEIRDSEMDRIDYACLIVDENEDPAMYVTVRELDKNSAYFQYGGSFPNYRGTPGAWHAFQALITWMLERYQRVSCLVENDNYPMLKFGIKAGFKITGVRCFKDKVLLEHALERK